jgi:hypothetical protein
MPFDKTNFAFDGHGGTAPRLHKYRTTDTVAVVDTVGYFNNISNLLRIHDVIFVASSTGGTPAYSFLVVNANANGVVDTTDATVLTVTDTD